VADGETCGRARRRWRPRPTLRYISRSMDLLKLSTDKIAPTAADRVASFHRGIVEEVAAAVAREPAVIVGMKTNPFVKKARQLLEGEGVKFTYLEYGGYTSKWKERLAIKLWAGFPTFPMVFLDGSLVGGHSELEKLKADGKLKR
jgi:glutaredoxin